MDSLRAWEWLEIAETEWDRAGRFLEQDDLIAAYCLNQALEALLFAFLLNSGHVPPVDSDYGFEDLIRLTSRLDPRVRAHSDTVRSVASLSILARHPSRGPSDKDLAPTLRAVRAALDGVRPLIEYIRENVPREEQ